MVPEKVQYGIHMLIKVNLIMSLPSPWVNMKIIQKKTIIYRKKHLRLSLPIQMLLELKVYVVMKVKKPVV